MKSLLIVILSFLFSVSHAAEIKCYSGKKTVYHGFGHDISYTDNFIAFIEDKSNKPIFIFAECVIVL